MNGNRFWWPLIVVAVVSAALSDRAARASSDVPPPIIGEIARPHAALAREQGPMCHASQLASAEPILPDRMGVLLQTPPTEAEHAFVELALTACEGLRGPVRLVADPFQVLALYRLESDLGVPDDARGLLVAAWCVETAMKARPSNGEQFLGDWREGVALAAGSFQLHQNVWDGTCRGTTEAPHDLLWAAGCWWSQVLKAEDKARKVSGCRERDLLRVGEAAASNVRRYGFRCDSRSGHWQMLDRMRALARRQEAAAAAR